MRDFLRLLRLMRPQAGWMALSVLLAATATLASIALMAISGWFVTAMALAGAAGVTMNYFTPSAYIRACALLRTGGRYAERIVGHEATLRFVASLRPWLFARMEAGAPATLQGLASGDLLSRLRGDIDRLETAFLRVLSPFAVALLALGPCLAVLAAHDGAMAIVTGLIILTGALIIPIILHAGSAASARRLARGSARLNALLVEEVQGLQELAVYDGARLHRARLLAASDALTADEQRLSQASSLATAPLLAAPHLALLGVLILGLPRLGNGGIAPAELPMLALLALATFDAVVAIPLAIQTIPTLLSSARRVFEVADTPAPAPEPAVPRAIPRSGALRLQGVGLTYPGASTPSLAGLDLDLVPGRRIAVVGPSGSGKSSIASLAMRFVPPSEGTIAFADVPYPALRGADIRDRLALMSQADHLFSGSIAENLRIADPRAGHASLCEACRIAQILDFIEAQPKGFDTEVGAHGTRLSGGEARRIALARALLARRPILILDEPTEGLDLATEAALLDALLDARPDLTLLLLTHRPARLERMDEIIRLEQGRVVARGGPAELARLLPPPALTT
ncbi:thiol reductant ABC exporter subunit CydC [Ancylobacter lacus]|uniref:thiol reductant ABC exporter subunit CydC n=1 Tax=Ancylobacter lacus TaxID=2579970 RepID=UPI001BCE6561|nr:thiol reductant ABC exporter subunit CydC [Ancylobacter lacus]MBS7540995.1 thiol reductant ABC exporter subunit CydC [Ancylobacter lacus]